MTVNKRQLLTLGIAVAGLAIGICLGLLAAGLSAGKSTLRIDPGVPVLYQCAADQTIKASYGLMSDANGDTTLGFVRLELPDGQILLLPQTVALSGVRYTDEVRWQWWTKGDNAFLKQRNAAGIWVELYPNCRIR